MLYLFLSLSLTIALLKEILKEVQVSNKKVASLEKQLRELRENGESSTGRKKKKTAPSPEVRVSLYALDTFLVFIITYVYCI